MSQSPIQCLHGLKSQISRHNTKMAELEARKATTQPKDLPQLHREIAKLAEVGAMLHAALAVGEIVVRDEQAKLDAARNDCIADLPQILGEVTQASGRVERALTDIRAAVAARNTALSRLEPLMLDSVRHWTKSSAYRDAIEHALHDILGLPERSSRETLSNRDSLIQSSCRDEAARVAGLKRAKAA